ncbi:hypothetical protein QL285_086170 [Trifolium repens]|nr:hypothetical protein QL285_086170 [Trifolium repens]
MRGAALRTTVLFRSPAVVWWWFCSRRLRFPVPTRFCCFRSVFVRSALLCLFCISSVGVCSFFVRSGCFCSTSVRFDLFSSVSGEFVFSFFWFSLLWSFVCFYFVFSVSVFMYWI